MSQQGILHNIADGVRDACHIWYDELRLVLKDEGVLIFFVIVPLIYPLLYSWIYNNETVREVPACVVDENRSHMSRDFVRRVDATPDVKVVAWCANMQEAQDMVKRRVVYGIIRVPESFADDLARMRQTSIRIYVDMSGMLYYKALLLSCTNV